MTQLFDTTTYADTTDTDGTYTDGADTAVAPRHLHSIPTGLEASDRSTQWRLDDQTIEIGRKGIQAARQALQDAAGARKTKPVRKAA